MEVTRRFIAITRQINGFPVESDFQIKSEALDLSSITTASSSVNIIVKNLFVSIDPYQISRMKTDSDVSQKLSSVTSTIYPGQAIDAYGVGEVVASGSPDFEQGDLVMGLLQWADYSLLVKTENTILRKLDTLGFPVTYHLGVLGFSGLTAYAGLFDVAKAKKGDKVFVSAASGSVGNLVGQYAKLHGCHVVGCASSNEKVALLKNKLGFDDAFNYKEERDLKLTLEKYFPDGIDVYFDNVGGEMLEAAVCNMNKFGRVAVCGAISENTKSGGRRRKEEARPWLDMVDIIYKRITIQGFLAVDYMNNVYSEFISKTVDYLRSGKIEILEDISIGVDKIPASFIGLFHGNHIGKKIVKLC